ncbi:MAG: branched-chain amino acid ABC transporter ATP-binding protein/permease [Rectinemataceae bacterium]
MTGITGGILERILKSQPEKNFVPRSRMTLYAAGAAVLLLVVYPLLPFVSDYWIDIGFYFGIYALLGMSLNVVLGEVGLFDLGHMGFYAIGAYVTAILNTNFGVPVLLLAPVSALVAGLFAWFATSPIIHLKGDYLCIVTIGIGEIVRLTMINNPFGVTGGPNGINGIDNPVIFVPIESSRQFYYYIWAVIALTVFALYRLQRSRTGRAWNYIREDEVAAEACGVDVRKHKLSAFVIGAALAGLAGNMYASKQMSVSPESFTFMESSLLFCIVLLGGLGSIPGTILGALVVTVFPEVFRSFASYRLLFFGAALMAMMIFKPAGLWPRKRGSGKSAVPVDPVIPVNPVALVDPVAPVAEKDECPDECPLESGGEILLRVEGAKLSFGGVSAVAGMDLDVPRGRITALIGPNGAGKTTVFNLITGIYKPQSGRILFKGEDISGKHPHAIVALGIARTFQNIRLFPGLTCLENVLCGPHSHGRAGPFAAVARTRSQRREEELMYAKAEDCLSKVGLYDLKDAQAGSLPYGKRRYLEIARALASDPALVVLDEPSSGLNDAETTEIAGLLASLLKEGYTILLIEHDMNLVDRVSDNVVVMQTGRKIAEGAMCDMRCDRRVIEAYLGEEED